MHINHRSDTFACISQDDGASENESQLSVAGKIKKHFNTGPKLSSTSAGVSVITVSTEVRCSAAAAGWIALLDDCCFITDALNGENIFFKPSFISVCRFCMQITWESLRVNVWFMAAVERWEKKNESSIFTSRNPCFVSYLVTIKPSTDCQYCCMEIFKNRWTVTGVSLKEIHFKQLVTKDLGWFRNFTL